LNSELLLSLESFNAMLAIVSFVLKETIVILWIADLLAEIQALRECSENRKKNKQEDRVQKQWSLVCYEVLYFLPSHCSWWHIFVHMHYHFHPLAWIFFDIIQLKVIGIELGWNEKSVQRSINK